jgi:DNA-binding Lrp family transcriptional regulator
MVSAMAMVIVLLAAISAIRDEAWIVLTRAAPGSKLACHLHLNLSYCTKRKAFSETTTMVPFFVQFKCKLGQSYAVANALAEAEIASEIYSTAGDYDLLVKFYVDNATDIGHFVNEKVQVIPGIQDTHTIITFKAFGGG